MKDAFGVLLNLGDSVIFYDARDKFLKKGTVIEFTPKKVAVRYGSFFMYTYVKSNKIMKVEIES